MAGYVQDTILLLGDSLTQNSSVSGGLGQELSTVYNRKLDVLYRGFGGYNSRWIIPVFEKVFAKKAERQNVPKVQLLTIWFGANDAVLAGEQQHVPLPEYSENLSKLVQMVKSPASEWYAPETRIVLFTPPPINTYQWVEFLKAGDIPRDTSDRTVENTRSYADAVIAVGQKEDVPVLDLYSIIWNAAGGEEKKLEAFLTDGLHLNEKSYKLVFDGLIDIINKKYPELHYDKFETVYPIWKDLNTDNYKELLKDSAVRK
ncbi:SGNH hydrolase [Trametopsis cervina]|nr:SGNH hydrolase [Trametopsis cervina]